MSILERVLSSKQNADIENFSPSETLSGLLRFLSEKERDILQSRYGLYGKKKETLEEIGKRFSVTRERIRQIEHQALAKMREKPEFRGFLHETETLIRQVLEGHGGVMSEDRLVKELLGPSDGKREDWDIVHFFLHVLLENTFEQVGAAEGMRPGIKSKTASLSMLRETVDHLVAAIAKEGKPAHFEELRRHMQEDPFFAQHRLEDEALLSIMEMAPEIARNPFGEWGLAAWGSIVPKRMNDKIYLVLKKHGKPLHFQEITKRINEIGFDDREAYAPTVHNELILNDRYVLVGRGTYALKEWGYSPGPVATVLRNILQASPEPLSRDELVRRVLEQRMVKKNTIHLALTDRTMFDKLPDGRYRVHTPTPNA